MIAFHDIKAELRRAIPAITAPCRADPGAPAQVARERTAASDDPDSPIEWWMEGAFEALTHASETGAPFALVPCFMNGEPAVVIALARPLGKKLHMMPLFLACQPWMNFSGQPGESGGGDEGGGPDRDAAAEAPAPR